MNKINAKRQLDRAKHYDKKGFSAPKSCYQPFVDWVIFDEIMQNNKTPDFDKLDERDYKALCHREG
jgi:hypothetical protein